MATELEYDKTSIASIFEYSKRLLGHSLNDVVDKTTFEESNLQGQGKGGLGQMIEQCSRVRVETFMMTSPHDSRQSILPDNTTVRPENDGGTLDRH